MKIKKILSFYLIISIICTTGLVPIVSAGEAEKPILVGTDEAAGSGCDEATGYHALSYDLKSVHSSASIKDIPCLGAPLSYDSRDYNYITSVKNQGSYTNCWAFAAINSAETDAIMDGRATKTEVDFSEAQMAYFFWHRESDPLGGTYGDMVSVGSIGDYLNIGGNNQLNTFSLASWISPSDESVMPYGQMAGYSADNVTKHMAYDSASSHMQNAYWINISDTDVIKQMIMEHGSVTSSMYSVSGGYNNAGGECYYYYPFDISQNHAISIVGWNDSIPAANFAVESGGVTYTPSKNGAWLVKNSYGSSWGNNGYFWLSYEDGGLTNSDNVVEVFDFEGADNYDNNYQYDGTVSVYQLEYSDKTSCYNANVFTTQSEEDLEAVGFYTTQPGMQYQIQIYRNLNTDSPIGKAVLTTPLKGTEAYAGYHTVKLNSAIELNKGETYSVVVKYISGSSGVSFFVDKTMEYSWLTCTSVNSKGQGYYSVGGVSWNDCSVDYQSNLRIKAFTNNHNSGVTPTTEAATTEKMTTVSEPTTVPQTTAAPTTESGTTAEAVTTVAGTTVMPTTITETTVLAPTTISPTTVEATTATPTTETPTTEVPITEAMTTVTSTTEAPTTAEQTTPLPETETSTAEELTTAAHVHIYSELWSSDEENHWHECNCGEKMGVSAHTYGDWIIDRSPTTLVTGTKHRVCSVCGYTELGITNKINTIINKETYSISYNANGQQGATGIPTNSLQYEINSNVMVQGTPICNNMFFVEWNTKADGTGISYQSGQLLKMTQNITLYAQWTDVCMLDNKLTFEVADNNEVVCTGTENKKAVSINIPKTISVNGIIYKVTAIADKAFYKNKKIKKVTVGNNVTEIGDSAFYKCKNLKTVKTGTGLTTIGKRAFWYVKKNCVITINSKKLKKVKGAISNKSARMKVKVPKKKIDSYKKIFGKISKYLKIK